jgi:hypothetical protein
MVFSFQRKLTEMRPDRINDTENNQSNYRSPGGNNMREETFHGDLEHTSPTDSRADEKVIINHRVAHAPSVRDDESDMNNGKENI